MKSSSSKPSLSKAGASIPLHPFVEIFPPMTEMEFGALRDSIQAHGQLEPISVWRGQVVDGRHRFRACKELGIKPKLKHLTDCEKEEVLHLVIAKNMNRRHLSPSQRGLIAAETILPLLAKDNAKGGRRSAQAGAILGVSARMVDYAKKIVEIAPDLVPQVRSGLLELRKADRIVRDRSREVESRVVNPSNQNPLPIEIWHGDCLSLLSQIPGESVDLLLTDPPYEKNSRALWEGIGAQAARILKPTGHLIALSGNRHANVFIEALDKNLRFQWIGAMIFSGSTGSHPGRRMISCQRPLLFYTRNSQASLSPSQGIPSDLLVTVEESRADRKWHSMGQISTPFASLIEKFCPKQGFVVDPCCGGGTVLVAARETGRRALGIEQDVAAYQLIKKRLGM
jgi:SAM-dependent methyltransferase